MKPMENIKLDCPYDFTSRCTMGDCDCKPKVETEHLNVSDLNDGKDYVEEIYVVRDKDADGALQPIISGNLIIKTKSGKTYKVGVKDL